MAATTITCMASANAAVARASMSHVRLAWHDDHVAALAGKPASPIFADVTTARSRRPRGPS